ncbi:2',3'-cyclic-nucleotide 2'-phosphodiesterase [bioreactor metagenome]|uniref:2',3'-cyclic-nucleotide 2'-phosphodiesterase n=1 Tax=bioreactor metagenome TaxID=1076179 RepID=A0A644YXJ1_9ZZZZ
MNILFIGDIVGHRGRQAVRELAPELRREFNVSMVIANAENVAAGNGLTGGCLRDLAGVVDFFTAGDHIWDQKDFEHEILSFNNIVRPANLSSLQPGVGVRVVRNPVCGELAVIALQGKIFMKESARCPFETAERILAELPPTVKTVLVDFHAEATSEKIAMGYFLEGRITALLGTHTHVQTADAQILPGGTAYLSDVGMVGAVRSVLGREVDAVVNKFRSGMPRRLPVAEGRIRLDACVVAYDPQTGRASGITPISRYWE